MSVFTCGNTWATGNTIASVIRNADEEHIYTFERCGQHNETHRKLRQRVTWTTTLVEYAWKWIHFMNLFFVCVSSFFGYTLLVPFKHPLNWVEKTINNYT